MDLDSLQGDPEFRIWLERLIEDKVRDELSRERDERFRESFALIAVRPRDSLAQAIARHLGKPLVPFDLVTFGDGEKKTVISENLSGKHVYVIATIGHGEDPDVSLANTLKLVATLRRTCKVRQINLVVPCLWYQAQDKTHARREPIAVRDVADDLIRRGMSHVIVVALHAEQIEIAFDSFDHLKTEPIFADYLVRRFCNNGEKLVLISPDDGGVRMREDLFKNITPTWVDGMAVVHQLRVRVQQDKKELLEFVGNVSGKIGVILDDMLRSGTTMFQAAKAAKQRGAKKVIGVVTHFYGFDSPSLGKFEDRLATSALDELICANTRGDVLERLEKSETLRSFLTVIDVSLYLAQAIRNYETGGTVKDMLRGVDTRELYRVAHGPDVS
ncbi:MAG: ribose-phosphate diphosphokinase [Planctomycetota bacterium]|nr:ribose-phosphate diphosphokinase [Planctomycetota bacterium]